MIGPNVLIVKTDDTTCPLTGTIAGLKEQVGGIVTSGVMEAQESVTPGEP
jgi:hypothetical protein